MFTLRCTSKLAKRLKVPLDPASSAATTRIGDWTCNLVHVGRQQFVVGVAEKTLLPVVVEAAPYTTMVPRFRAALADVLRMLGVPVPIVEAEIAEMYDVRYGKTSSRQVVGVGVEFARVLPFWLDDATDALKLSLKLAEMPTSPLYKTAISPDRATAKLFGVREFGRTPRSQ